MDIECASDYFNSVIAEFDFFDINVWWDPTADGQHRRLCDFAQMERELKNFNISKAIISNRNCLKYDPVAANEELAVYIKSVPNLFGCMILVPEIESIEAYIDNKVGERFICARLFPKTLHHSMKKWCIDGVLSHLERRNIPLILWHTEVEWDTYEALTVEYPELPLIIDGCETKLLYHNRNYTPLLLDYRNIYMETHNIVLAGELDCLSSIVGDKLIYGSYYSYNTPNASMYPIVAGQMPYSTKRLISSGTLTKLISNIIQ